MLRPTETTVLNGLLGQATRPRHVAFGGAFSETVHLWFCCSKGGRYDGRKDTTTESAMKTMNPAVARVLKRLRYPLDVILTCVR